MGNLIAFIKNRNVEDYKILPISENIFSFHLRNRV